MPEDYWPASIAEGNIVTPVSMMREQATLLGPKTNQQITANVVNVNQSVDQFMWSFQLASAALASYRYELFRVAHTIVLYPATVIWEGHPNRSVPNEETFRQCLKEILSSNQTTRIVQALLAQIRK